VYDERQVRARRAGPCTARSHPGPPYPDNSRYQNLGLFGQTHFDLAAALRLAAGLRLTGVRFATSEDRIHGVPESSQWFRDVTFHTSLRYQIRSSVGIHGLVSRGFRAPNLNDLGALGQRSAMRSPQPKRFPRVRC
jgi:outer membrane receptor protein involved in Fe transport